MGTVEIKISDFDMKQMAERAIADQLRSEFNSSYSSLKKRFEKGLDDALAFLAPEIDAAVKQGVRAALLSSEFNQRLQDALIKACSDKFGGAMNAIMKAAAKRAATDAGLQKDVETVVVAAARHPMDSTADQKPKT